MLQIQLCNPKDGEVLVDGATGLFFGSVVAGKTSSVVLLKISYPDPEIYLSELRMLLQSDGGLSDSEFQYHYSETFKEEISALENMRGFSVEEDSVAINEGDNKGIQISLVDGKPIGYVWLRLKIGAEEKPATSSINYRFLFNYV